MDGQVRRYLLPFETVRLSILGLRPETVPGLCGDEDKMPERCGQVATAIVQSVTSRLPGLHRKITAAGLVFCKTI